MTDAQLLGATICLISRSKIRYEGILSDVNSEKSAISLKHVKVFGTENRREDGKHIPSSDKIYECIVFNGADILELDVVSRATPAPAEPPQPAPQQRPIPPVIAPKESKITSQTAEDVSKPNKKKKGPRKKKEEQTKESRQRKNSVKSIPEAKHSAVPGMGKHLLNRKVKGSTGESANNDITADFDFEKMNQKFNELKLQLLGKPDASSASSAASEQSVDSDDNDFFDTISSAAQERAKAKKTHTTFKEESKINTETFGATALAENRRNNRRPGRGRWNRRNQATAGSDKKYHKNTKSSIPA